MVLKVLFKNQRFMFVLCYAKEATIDLVSKDCKGHIQIWEVLLDVQSFLGKSVTATKWLGLSWHRGSLCSAFPAIWY